MTSHSRKNFRLLTLVATLSLAHLTTRAEDYFLKFTGPSGGIGEVVGESTDQNHPKEIEVTSWSFGLRNQINIGSSSGGAGAGKASAEEFTFTMPLNKASVALAKSLAIGGHYDRAVLTIRKAGSLGTKTAQDYAKYTFALVYVTSIKDEGLSASERPMQTITLGCGAVQLDYTSVDPKSGKPDAKPETFVWSFTKNAAVLQTSLQGGTTSPTLQDVSAPAGIEQVLGQNLKASPPREVTVNGQRFLSLEVSGPSLASSGARAQTSENLKQWFGEGIIEVVAVNPDGSTSIQYSIPMDKAQQFLRVSTQQ